MTGLEKTTEYKPSLLKILVTGAAGFIGFHLLKKLLKEGHKVTGIDNFSPYYETGLKEDRLKALGFLQEQLPGDSKPGVLKFKNTEQLKFYKTDLGDRQALKKIFENEQPEIVVNLAAQAGVRYSLKNPYTYIDSNINGFMNILENCRNFKIKHLVYASSSSVYGANKQKPFSVHHNVDHPISLYAATKKSNELMAHTYSHLYKIPTTGLRFFTVYGPWGRPDMSYYIFTKNILNNIPIKVFNYGKMKRDFTYIDDIIEGVFRVMLKSPRPNNEWDSNNPDPASSLAPYRIFNIGNNQPVDLLYFIKIIEKKLGKEAKKELLPIQKGDVEETFADINELKEHVGFSPKTTIEDGLEKFIQWYLSYYGGNK